MAPPARDKESTNRGKVETKCAVGGKAYYVSKTGAAAGEDAGKAS